MKKIMFFLAVLSGNAYGMMAFPLSMRAEQIIEYCDPEMIALIEDGREGHAQHLLSSYLRELEMQTNKEGTQAALAIQTLGRYEEWLNRADKERAERQEVNLDEIMKECLNDYLEKLSRWRWKMCSYVVRGSVLLAVVCGVVYNLLN